MLNDANRARLHASAGIDSLTLLEALPPEVRVAIRGRVIERRDYAELADELGCSELLLRQRVSRGLRTLRTLAGPR
jgi:DNA-directed RNA polymerase specialized sigma24 family protein